MNILHVGIFQDHCLGGDIIFRSGFRKLGVGYREFDYRTITREIGVEAMNQRLADEGRGSDLVFVGKGELVLPSTFASLRRTGSCVVIWYGDRPPEPDPWLIDNLHECDVFFMSSAGEELKRYFREGRPGRAAFYMNPSDPDIVNGYDGVPRSVDPPLFSGTRYHPACRERFQVAAYLSTRRDVQIIGWGTESRPGDLLGRLRRRLRPVEYLRGDAYIARIIRAKLGIGVSRFQDVKYYTSDRLVHYLSFGKLYLAYRFPGCEDLLRGERDLVYYDDTEHLGRLIDHFLANPREAEEIGRRGQERMLREYNAKNIILMMMDVINTGRSERFPWVEVLS